jgi:HEAT repeat protein
MRLLGVLLVCLACAAPTQAYIDRAPSLADVIRGSQHILVLQVDKVNHDKRVILFKKVADLKGAHPAKEMKHQLSDGLHPREPKIILSWAEPGETAICFVQGNTAQVCIGPYWYECVAGEAPWWSMSYGRPEMSCGYIGSVARLRGHVTDFLAGKDIVVTAVARRDVDWAAHGDVFARNMMRDKECRLWRVKANGERVGRGPHAVEELPALLRALQDKDEAIRAEVAANLGLMGRPARPALAGLHTALKDPAPLVRVRAAEAVARIDLDPRAPDAVVPVLVTALQEERPKVRQAAAEALWVMGADAHAAVPKLAGRLSDKSPYVRWASLETLGRIGGAAEQAVPAVVELLKDSDLRGIAVQALGNIGPKARAGLPALLQEFKAGNGETYRMSVAWALIRIEPQSAKVAVPLLIERVKRGDDRISLEAIQALMAMGPEARAAIPALTEVVRGGRDVLPAWSAYALARIAGREAPLAIPHVLELLDHDIVDASDLVAELGPPAVPAVLDVARRKEGSIRHRAGRSLGLIGSRFPEAIPALVKALKDKDVGARQAAAEAFWVISRKGREAVPALTETLQDNDIMVRHGAAWGLVHVLGSEATAAVPVLIALAGKPEHHQNVRRSAIVALGTIGRAAKEAAPLLASLEKDPFYQVAATRGRFLVSGAEGKTVVPVLITVLKDKNPWARREAATFLAELGPAAKEALPALTDALSDDDDEACKAIVNAWRRVGKP